MRASQSADEFCLKQNSPKIKTYITRMSKSTEENSFKSLLWKSLTYLGSNAAIFFLVKYTLAFTSGLFSSHNQKQGPFQYIWDLIASKFGHDYYFYHVIGLNVVLNVLYFGVGFVFMIMDLTNYPKALRKYKVSPKY